MEIDLGEVLADALCQSGSYYAPPWEGEETKHLDGSGI